MDDKILRKSVLEDYGETVVGGAAGTQVGATSEYLNFDGTNDYVTITADGTLNDDDLTISLWVYPDQLRIQGIMDKNNFGTSWRLFMNSAGGGIEFDGLSDSVNLIAGVNLSVSTWSHVLVTYDKSITRAIIYINGSAANANSSFTTAGNNQNNSVVISPIAGSRFDGRMNDVRIFNRALTSDEVTTLYTGGTVTSGLVAHLPFDNGSGSALDVSGNGNDGALTGPPDWVSGSAAYTIDLTAGNVCNVVLRTDCEFTFANPPESGVAGTFTLFLKQGGSGGHVVTWPAAVVWSGGSIPTLTTFQNSVDIFTFFTVNAGTRWYGFDAAYNLR